jgi:hypothetical protein
MSTACPFPAVAGTWRPAGARGLVCTTGDHSLVALVQGVARRPILPHRRCWDCQETYRIDAMKLEPAPRDHFSKSIKVCHSSINVELNSRDVGGVIRTPGSNFHSPVLLNKGTSLQRPYENEHTNRFVHPARLGGLKDLPPMLSNTQFPASNWDGESRLQIRSSSP